MGSRDGYSMQKMMILGKWLSDRYSIQIEKKIIRCSAASKKREVVARMYAALNAGTQPWREGHDARNTARTTDPHTNS